MRELYFRGKGIFNKEWVYGHSIRNTLGDKKRMLAKQFEIRDDAEDNNFWWTAVDPNTVGQWTGLLDNKGNKIFEGDIVEGTITSAWAKKKIKCKVVYIKDSFVCVEDRWAHKVLFGKDIEIIGNIYDTPKY